MKLVDSNVLLYVVNESAPHHERVRTWWEAAVADDEHIGLSWVVLLSFLRIATHPRVFARPLTPPEAVAKLETWFGLPSTRIVTETEEHWPLLERLIDETGRAGDLTTDAHLAALAISYGAAVVSCDGDFGRFRQIRWENPLASS